MSSHKSYVDLTLLDSEDEEIPTKVVNHIPQARARADRFEIQALSPYRSSHSSVNHNRQSTSVPKIKTYDQNTRSHHLHVPRDRPSGLQRVAATSNVSNEKGNKRIPNFPVQPEPLVSPRSKSIQRRACTNCADASITCDGEQPCSACVEPGLPCIYPGEKPMVGPVRDSFLASTQKPSPAFDRSTQQTASPVPAGLATRTRVLSQPSSSVGTRQFDLLPNELMPTHTMQGRPSEGVQSKQDADFDDSDDTENDDDVPLALADLEEVKRLLQKYQARMQDHRTYLLQPLLNQAKLLDSEHAIPYASNTTPGPFNKLITASKQAKQNSPKKASSVVVQMKSHRLGAAKKWTSVAVPMKVVDAHPVILPKYKSIGRLGTSLLAPNIRTLKYWPYFPDEENLDPSEAKKNEELEERYQHDDNHLLAQRKCSELIDMWRPWVQDFVSKLGIEFRDILYWFLHTREDTSCETCDKTINVEDFKNLIPLLRKPSERSLTLAQLSVTAIQDIAKINMWHVVFGAPSIEDLIKQSETLDIAASRLCSICFLHDCLIHGAYQEPEESGGALIMGGNIEINDEELEHNTRLAASIPNQEYNGLHVCGLYCVAAEARVKDLLGRRKDGSIGGIHNRTVHVPRLTLNNSAVCSDDCYWPTERRTRYGSVLQAKGFEPKIPEQSKILFRRSLRIYCFNQRAPCMLAKRIQGLSCLEAFYFMLAEVQRVSHYQQNEPQLMLQQSTRKIARSATGFDATLSADLDERPPFIPCSHLGPCLNNPDCSCAQNKVHCEWFCGCIGSCERRFPGCKCASANKSCFNDRSCECWKHNRECDPWLCASCGAVEVLDPRNKYIERIRDGRCKNNRIQLDLPARTIKAPSEVQGWGLYAGEVLEENAFIGEYKGETVGNQESDRRGAVYANIGQEYLFVMNRDQQIDGSNFGNKTRFINNSQRDDYINVLAKKLLCNGVQRVMLYAKRPITTGEELLYNYNYPISVTKKFWERGEGPTNVPGAVVAKPSITWTQPRTNGRFAKLAGKQDGERSPSDRLMDTQDGPMERKESKRKRAIEGSASLAYPDGTAAARGDGSVTLENGQLHDDPEDSDFQLVNGSDNSESAGEDEGGSDIVEASASTRRRRMVYPADRRRGGLAQAKAWETRRRKIVRGK